ncbi:MAG: HDOD domain-containing protein [Pseudomonadota bacterium]
MKYKVINYRKLAAQPDIISRIINLDTESENCYRDLDKLLRIDQSVAALVLRVANSPMYNRGKQIKTFPIAINLLGINIIRSLAVLALSRSIFNQSRNHLITKHLWQHSLLTAITSQMLCVEMGNAQEGEEAFIAGLLHDIGKILLFTHYTEQYLTTLKYILETNCPSAEAELQFLGIDHYEVGKQAIVEWKLPEYFKNYTGINLDSLTALTVKDKIQHSLAVANSLIKGTGIGATQLELSIRKNRLINLGMDDEFSDYLLGETFSQKVMQNELYQQCA